MVEDVVKLLREWDLDINLVREQVYHASTPRERERWLALWLFARGWSAAKVAKELERDPHTVGDWLDSFRREGPKGLIFEQTCGSPTASTLARKSS